MIRPINMSGFSKKVAEKYLGDKQEEINQDKKDKEDRRD